MSISLRSVSGSKCLFNLDSAASFIFYFLRSFTTRRTFYDLCLCFFIFDFISAMNRNERKLTFTEAQVVHPWIQKTRQLVSHREVGHVRLTGQFRGRGRVRTLSFSASISEMQSMKIVEQDGSQMIVEREEILSTETGHFEALRSGTHPVLT